MRSPQLLVLFLGLGLAESDVIFDVFEYGGSYKHLNSPMKFLPPSRELTEVTQPRYLPQ